MLILWQNVIQRMQIALVSKDKKLWNGGMGLLPISLYFSQNLEIGEWKCQMHLITKD